MPDYKKTLDAVSALSPEQFRVTQENGTERPGMGQYLDNTELGIYVDIVSGEPLFPASRNLSITATSLSCGIRRA